MRPAILNPLFVELSALKGVGPHFAGLLERLDIRLRRDLLFHLPSGRIDRTQVGALDDAPVGGQIIIDLSAGSYSAGRSSRAPFRVEAFDRNGDHVSLVYFGKAQGIAKRSFPLGEWRRVSGRLDCYGDQLQIVHPDRVGDVTSTAPPATEAVYPLTEGVTNTRLSALTAAAIADAPDLDEWIEPSLRGANQWPSWRDAVVAVHGGEVEGAARDRLAYDELLANQLAMAVVRQSARQRAGRTIAAGHDLRSKVALPWPLTGAQRRVIDDIDADMASGAPMLRLLQGDVGSGKTVVAVLSMLSAVEAGAQAVLLAPTEILARQHFAAVTRLLEGCGVNVAILTGREKGAARQATLDGLAEGRIGILVGTHAVFQDSVAYKDLALVVIDEQHKFGVAQRLALTRKGVRPPHVLAMTATPIPRTMMLAAYGEMDESRIDELPPGRSPIDTRVVSIERLADVVAGLARHLDAGHRAYWVCPFVEENAGIDCAAAEERAAILSQRFGSAVGLVHGRMKGAERDAVMDRFKRGDITLLVATTVIEVGVDVPEASLMIVESAERFGLAQLHQLRGRVGRGTAASTCLLLRATTIGETARARLALMRETQDGFRIADEDLRLRGGGELLGTRQSGEQGFRLASAGQVDRLIESARQDARLLLERDGGLSSPRGMAARALLYLFDRDAGVQLLRGG